MRCRSLAWTLAWPHCLWASLRDSARSLSPTRVTLWRMASFSAMFCWRILFWSFSDLSIEAFYACRETLMQILVLCLQHAAVYFRRVQLGSSSLLCDVLPCPLRENGRNMVFTGFLSVYFRRTVFLYRSPCCTADRQRDILTEFK